MKKLAMLSTGHRVIARLGQIVRELDPEVKVANFLCDDVVDQIAANGGQIPASVMEELLLTALAAQRAQADAVLVTCSSISEFVDMARPFLSVPIYKIDQPMLEAALDRGRTIGVLATAETSLRPTLHQLEQLAQAKGVQYEARAKLCSDAFQAFLSGNTDLHDVIVSHELAEMYDHCDVMVLAQVSMSSALERCQGKFQAKTLTCPRSGVEQVIDSWR